MNPRRYARRFVLLGGLAVVVASGAYVVVYLYRWEWHRALIAGIFLIAAEVGVIGAVLFDRLHALQARLDRQERAARAVTPAAGRQPAGGPFGWLDPNRTSVFVPILLGAGVLLSALAYVVERFARWSAPPAVDAPTDRLLRDLTSPAGEAGPVPRPTLRRLAVPIVVTLLLALVAGEGLVELMSRAKSRPEPGRADWVTTVEVELVTRDGSPAGERSLTAMAVACRPSGADVEVRRSPTPERWQVLVQPSLGHIAERRFTGCLGDAVVDHVLVYVRGVWAGPESGGQPGSAPESV